MMSDKIRPYHLERKALLYVRQSSAHQVLHNRESSALQYAMRGPVDGVGLVGDRGDRRRSGSFGSRWGAARRLRAYGSGSLPRQGRGGVRPRSLPLCPQQPRLAAADRDVPGGRHGADRSGDGLCAPPWQ